ncbi:holliday junction resolvase (hjc) [Candidatus Fervidibacteria bacterium JGI MDM2 JNZ-1-D12]
MGTLYQRGAKQEHRLKHILRSFGFEVVRAAGSHGKFDIWAFDGRRLLLIQLKKRKPPLNGSFGITIAPSVEIVSGTIFADKGFWVRRGVCLFCFLRLDCPTHKSKVQSCQRPSRKQSKQPKSCRRRSRNEL